MALTPNTYHVAKITEDSRQEIAKYNEGVVPEVEELPTYFIFGGSLEEDYYAIITEDEFIKNYEFMYASDQGCTFRMVSKKI